MATVKTAISIDTDIYKKVECISKQLHISRSQFFSQAAQYMLDRAENLELLYKINAGYAHLTSTESESDLHRKEKKYRATRNTEQW